MNRRILLLLCLLSWAGWGTVQAQESDCRLELDQLEPIITRFNPYFSNHQWSLETRMELARMGNERLLMITQDGCKRHHTVFTLVMDQAVVEDGPEFWINETAILMRRAFYERSEYQEFGATFEDTFAEKFLMYGVGRRFNFPIGTRNFICEVSYRPGEGARLMVEMIEYIFKDEEVMRQRTGPSEDDDGWIGQDRH